MQPSQISVIKDQCNQVKFLLLKINATRSNFKIIHRIQLEIAPPSKQISSFDIFSSFLLLLFNRLFKDALICPPTYLIYLVCIPRYLCLICPPTYLIYLVSISFAKRRTKWEKFLKWFTNVKH